VLLKASYDDYDDDDDDDDDDDKDRLRVSLRKTLSWWTKK
jgi:hypothetical protein